MQCRTLEAVASRAIQQRVPWFSRVLQAIKVRGKDSLRSVPQPLSWIHLSRASVTRHDLDIGAGRLARDRIHCFCCEAEVRVSAPTSILRLGVGIVIVTGSVQMLRRWPTPAIFLLCYIGTHWELYQRDVLDCLDYCLCASLLEASISATATSHTKKALTRSDHNIRLSRA